MDKFYNSINVSVIIPAKNEEEFITFCLDSIKKAFEGKTNYEIIVVNNNSEDNTLNIAKKFHCKIINNQNSGAASTRNLGATYAKGKFLAFIDADCILNEKWFEYVYEYFRDFRVAAVGTKICPNLSSATWVEKANFYLNIRRGILFSKNATKVNWIGTSNVMVKKEYFTKIGGFDENLISCEDYDFCQRLSRIGEILIDNRILTIHLREDKSLIELFKNEIFRSKDSLNNWIKNRLNFYEAPSILLPAFFLISIFCSIIFFALDFKIAVFFCILSFFNPLLFVIRSRKLIKDPILFIQGLIVASIYLLARSVSLIRGVFVNFKESE